MEVIDLTSLPNTPVGRKKAREEVVDLTQDEPAGSSKPSKRQKGNSKCEEDMPILVNQPEEKREGFVKKPPKV
jgi:hypothetical protein